MEDDRKIYDCFPFFNEIEMLRMRCEELKEVVDEFVLVESTTTFSGKPKRLYFKENKAMFEGYNIRHIVADLKPDPNPWVNEKNQRNHPSEYLRDAVGPSDIVSLCDLDEIPRPEVLMMAKRGGVPVPSYLEMDFYYYNFDWVKRSKWYRASIISATEIERYTLEDVRSRRANIKDTIPNAGWHLSYFMSAEMMREKIMSFAHQEYNNEMYTEVEGIRRAVASGKDLFHRGEREDLLPRGPGRELPVNAGIFDFLSADPSQSY